VSVGRGREEKTMKLYGDAAGMTKREMETVVKEHRAETRRLKKVTREGSRVRVRVRGKKQVVSKR